MEKEETAALLKQLLFAVIVHRVSHLVGCQKFRQTDNDGHFVLFISHVR
jgi:hypothetical protein